MSHGGDTPITCIHCHEVIKTYRRITGETVVNCGCGEHDILGQRVDEEEIYQSDAEDTFEFEERPASKSSTNILVNVPGKIACQICGCREDEVAGTTKKEGCQCNCHD